jgi:glycogen debranching enzyme
MVWNRPGYTTLEGDHLLAVTPRKSLSIFTSGELLRQLNTGLTNPYLAVSLDGPVAVSTSKALSAGQVREIIEAQKSKMLQNYTQFGECTESVKAMQTCMAWDTIFEPEQEQICSPVSRLWSIGWGGYVLFDWDTYFSAMLAMSTCKELAYANARAITRQKTERGFIPNFGAADDFKSRDRSQPPVGSLAVREIYRIYREKEFVASLFEDLLEWNRWFASNRMLSNSTLAWGSTPYISHYHRPWEINGVGTTLGASLESGLDNSPMYDDIPFNPETNCMCLSDVGLTALYILDCENLADLAQILGRDEHLELTERAQKCKLGLETLWDEEHGMYYNRRTDTGELSFRLSPTNFYALFSDSVSPSHAQAMSKHFLNKEEMFGEYMLPSISRSDIAFADQDYWRGRIWAPMNYLVYIALRKAKRLDEAKILAQKSRELLLKEWNLHGHVHENYDANTGMGCGVRNSDKFYHWGGLLGLVDLIDNGFVSGPEIPLSP